MKIDELYLNNYKGFVDTFLSFEDVTFLVGENSTGKTAVLNIMRILSSPQFQFSGALNDETFSLGYFSEIMNQRFQGKGCSFEVGMQIKQDGKLGNNIDSFKLYSYRNSKDVPTIATYRCTYKNLDVKLCFPTRRRESLLYYIREHTISNFHEWVHNDNFTDSKELSLKTRKGIQYFPLGIVCNLVFMEIEKYCDKKKSSDIGIPLMTSDNFYAIAPIRAKAQRYYEGYMQKYSAEGIHIPVLLKQLVDNKRDNIINSINKFGQQSGLYDEIKVKTLGKGRSVPFKLTFKYGDIESNIINVGYGIPQILPLIIEILTSKEAIFSLQQPEVHLHPKAQAAFGEFIFNSFEHNKNRFLIETHSDFTIDRFRLQLKKENCLKKPTAQVLYFERKYTGTKVTRIAINIDGSYAKNQPESFRSFFLNEEFEMLQI